MQILDVLALVTWSCGVFLAPLMTALPRYRRASWWLWPSLRVIWQVGGGVVAGMGTAHLVGAGPRGLLVGGLLVGAAGCLVAAASLLALFRGPRGVQGALVSVRSHDRLQWLPQAPAARVHSVTVGLNTAEGHRELLFRGMQGRYAQQELGELSPGTVLTVLHLPALRCYVGLASQGEP